MRLGGFRELTQDQAVSFETEFQTQTMSDYTIFFCPFVYLIFSFNTNTKFLLSLISPTPH